MGFDSSTLEETPKVGSEVTIKRTSTAGGKIVERKLVRAIADTHEQVVALIDNAVQEFVHLDSLVGELNNEGA